VKLYKTPRLLRTVFPQMLWKVPTRSKEIYLTFDDGPIPGLTEYVLDLLADHEAKATFFCVGDNIRKHAHIFDRIMKEGHGVGNHTYNHLDGWKSNTHHYLHNVAQCASLIDQALSDHGPRLFRPPYGKITIPQYRALKGMYQCVMWDVLSYDFDQRTDAGLALHRITELTQPGTIIVFHDNLKAETNLKQMLPKYIQHFKAAGYCFKSLNGLLNPA
jgi:peptidoglycan/xylan/chitin deacetylase (PgdA/CDA1 family)